MGSPRRAGVFLDFDGVLADIAPAPDAAIPRRGVPELLVRLAGRLGRVAVVSGRPVDYVAPFLDDAVDVVGLYGLEWRVAGDRGSLPEAEDWREAITAMGDAARAGFGSAVVEAKGLSLTLHYRRDPQLLEPLRAWAEEQAEESGVELRRAKQSFELHPPLASDKGTALLDLAVGLDPVCYLGDDLGDLAAFDGLDQLAARGVTTVRVAVDSPEVPPIMLRRADLVVAGPAGAEALLRQLAARLGID